MEQIVPVILILVGVLFLIIGLVLTLCVKAASKWPTTTGSCLNPKWLNASQNKGLVTADYILSQLMNLWLSTNTLSMEKRSQANGFHLD